MEVHAHTHTPRKKWTHYFWEFIMLFLAVTLGFFVENQREHFIEHRREKQFMRSMIEDLSLDTAEYNDRIMLLDSILLPVLDTAKKIIYHKVLSGDVIKEMYEFIPRCSRFFDVSVEDRTMSQLKYSGNLRLIRSKMVTDSLAAYWKIIDIISNTLLRGYELSRIEVKNISFSLFSFSNYEGNNPYDRLINDVQLKLVSDNKQEFIKLANFISNLHSQANGPIKWRVKEAKDKAKALIRIIRDEYHFE